MNEPESKVLSDIVLKAMGVNRMRNYVLIALVVVIASLSLFKFYSFMSKNDGDDKDFIAVVDFEGAITSGNQNNAYSRISLLEKSFRNPRAKAILLTMNSGGGSPSQAQIIHDRIIALKSEYNKPVIAVIDDVCASACYLIAVSADEIVINKMGIVGSIGVLMPSWNFTELMSKAGVKQDTLYAGKYKTLISSFQEKDPDVVTFLEQEILSPLHKTFIDVVLKGRVGRIPSSLDSSNNLFSGLIWTAEKSVKLGLTDAIGDSYSVRSSRDEWRELPFKNMEPPINNLKRLLTSFGVDLTVEAIDELSFIADQSFKIR